MYHQIDHISQPLIFRTLRGQLVVVRQVMAADTFLLAELLCRLSEHASRLRYMRSGRLTAEAIWGEAVRMARGGSIGQKTLVATIRPSQEDEAVAVAELVRDQQDQTVGEIALVVRDDEQQQGIGSFLLWRLIRLAQRNGITSLRASMRAENSAMLRLIDDLGLPYTATTRSGETQVLVQVPRCPRFSLAPRIYIN